MITREERVKRLFNTKTGNTVIIPMDHGILGVPQYLEDPVKSFERFTALQIDATLVNFGVLKLIENKITKLKNPLGVIMTVDFNQGWNSWKKPIEAQGIIGHCLSATIEQAVKHNADAVKVYFALGLDKEVQLQVIKNIANVIAVADKYDMPVMVEPTTDGQFIADEKRNDPQIIADGSRMAVELGADILKIPYPYGKQNCKEIFSSICANSHVPVVMLGGAKKDGVKDILQIAKNGVDEGANGTIFGRNVWQRPSDEVERVIKALKDIVHNGAGVDDVMHKYNLK